jgi:hypothetical protein
MAAFEAACAAGPCPSASGRVSSPTTIKILSQDLCVMALASRNLRQFDQLIFSTGEKMGIQPASII